MEIRVYNMVLSDDHRITSDTLFRMFDETLM